MAKKSMVPFSAAVAADVLSAFHLPGGNTLQVGLQLCRDKARRDSRCPPLISGDEEIARVANSYGRRVSAEEVHNNPLNKFYLCQTIGYDWRLQSPCAGYLPHGGG